LNGRLNNTTDFAGLILQTSIDLTIGRVLPNNTGYNFKGILDEIRIYNQALSDTEIRELYQQETPIQNYLETVNPESYALFQNYPNPFNQQTRIRYQLPRAGRVELRIYDILGQEICRLWQAEQPAGTYSLNWNGRNAQGETVASGLYFYEIRVNEFQQKRKLLLLK